MRRTLKQPAPLPAGKYVVRTRESTVLSAAANGHSEIFPEAQCVSDGKWCLFFRDGREVRGCNSLYAAAHFDCVSHGE